MSHVSRLTIPLLSACGALILLGYASWKEYQRKAPSVIIAVEHAQPLTLTLSISARGNARMIDLAHEGRETVFISVPETWERTEVRGVGLKDVTSESPAMGFVRWKIPEGGSVGFRAQGDFRKTIVHNPSRIPLELRWTVVDLENDRARHDVNLVTDTPVTLP